MRSRQRVGYLRIRHKADPSRKIVRVSVEHQGEELHFESEGPVTINEVLSGLGIPPSTVLAVHGEKIVPHTSTINDDTRIELVVVSSGG